MKYRLIDGLDFRIETAVELIPFSEKTDVLRHEFAAESGKGIKRFYN